MSICGNNCENGGAGESSAPKPAWLDSFEAARTRDMSGGRPLGMEDEILEEELILEQIADYLTPSAARPEVLTAIARGLNFIKAFWAKASFANKADAILEVLYLLGASRSPEMRMKARILLSLAAKENLPLAAIAGEFGVSRAAVSKTAREIKDHLGLQVHGSTRDDLYVQQCRERATRVHEQTRKDRLRAAGSAGRPE